MNKPTWWPECPYPEDIFPMRRERYKDIVPDSDTRTALSGCLGRIFWGIAAETIFEKYQQAVQDGKIIELGLKIKEEK